MGNSPSLLLIGIDGADHEMLSKWLRAGELPALGALLGHGCLLRSQSTRPALTAPAWKTIFTGCSPGKHGVYDFLDFGSPERRPWWTLPHAMPSVWERLTAAGKTVTALNVPMTYPAEQVNGVMVSGFGSPALTPEAFSPAELREELLAAVPDYELQPEGLEPGAWPSVDVLRRDVDIKARAAHYLMAGRDAEVFAVVFHALDWTHHGHAWREGGDHDPLLAVMRDLDARIGELVALTDWPKANVLVFSDHGMRRVTRQANLVKLFIQLSLTAVRETEGGSESAGGRPAVRRLLRVWNAAKQVLPASLIHRLRRLAHRQRQALLEAAPRMTMDRTATVAQPVGPCGYVRLNLKGRDAGGIVEPDSYRATRDQVAARLRAATDTATGERIFSDVTALEELYGGAMVGDGPDLLLTAATQDMAFGVPASDRDLVAFLQQEGLVTPLVPVCGDHSPWGVALLSGDAVRTEPDETDCTVADLAPTILHLMGAPVPSYMDGHALVGCLQGEPAERAVQIVEESIGPATAGTQASDEDDEALKDRLRALGYL